MSTHDTVVAQLTLIKAQSSTMESQLAQSMGSSFFYYQPDPHSEHRQHGHFTPHPQMQPQFATGPIQFHPEMMKQYHPQMHFQQSPIAPTVVYSQSAAFHQMMPTPLASPRPVSHRPSIFIERQSSPRLLSIDTDCSPVTPALSCSGSGINSPPSSCGMISTPVNGLMECESLVGVKHGCEGDVLCESLASGEWSRSQSPPLSPSKFWFLPKSWRSQLLTNALPFFSLCELILEVNSLGTFQSLAVCKCLSLIVTITLASVSSTVKCL